MDKAQVLQKFWAGFGMEAYDENTVPDNAPLPRITHQVSLDSFDNPVSISASLWYRSTSWAAITQKSEEIARAIGRGGLCLKCDGGYVWIKRGTPFSQRMSDPDDSIRRIYLNTEVEFMTEN